MDTVAQWIGERLLAAREKRGPGITMAQLADELYADVAAGRVVPPAPDRSASMCDLTRRKYHDELQERARNGDRHAVSILLGKGVDDG